MFKSEIAIIDWCPQICPSDVRSKGYILEILDKVFEDFDSRFVLVELPWSRAIQNTARGSTIGVLAPAKKEAPELIYPNIPIGIQRMCFFVDNSSMWKYSGVQSLENKTFGIATDTSIEELDWYVKKHPENFQFQPYHERYVEQSIKKLKKNRIDAFIFTRNSTLYKLKELGVEDSVKLAGCVSSSPVFLAFSPANHLKETSIKLAKMFDANMVGLIRENKIDYVLDKYAVGFDSNDLLDQSRND